MTDHLSVPDRYADAVRARRGELRAVRALLVGGHRVELRHLLAASRLAASAQLAAALAGLGRELRDHVARADAVGRAALPSVTGVAVARMVDRVVAGWAAAVLAGLRRVAAARCAPGTPLSAVADPVVALAAGRPAVALPGPDPPAGVARAVIAGGTWRVALLPAAVLPAVGLPALGGRAVVPPALAVAAALLVAGVRVHRVAADRARLRRWADEVVATVRAAVETELARRVVEVERVAGAELDELVARHLERVDAELRALQAGVERAGEG